MSTRMVFSARTPSAFINVMDPKPAAPAEDDPTLREYNAYLADLAQSETPDDRTST